MHSKPAPDDPRKPDSPGDLTARSKRYVGRKVIREFMDDQCLDLAAALTYYAMLAIFPAMLALVSLLGLIGQAEESVDTALDILRPLLSPQAIEALERRQPSTTQAPAANDGSVVG